MIKIIEKIKKGNGPVGTWPISVVNNINGLANINSAVKTFTFPLSISSFSPNYGGTGGGLILTINGSGYSKQTKVLIDNIVCPITSFIYTSINCQIPSNVCVFCKWIKNN